MAAFCASAMADPSQQMIALMQLEMLSKQMDTHDSDSMLAMQRAITQHHIRMSEQRREQQLQQQEAQRQARERLQQGLLQQQLQRDMQLCVQQQQQQQLQEQLRAQAEQQMQRQQTFDQEQFEPMKVHLRNPEEYPFSYQVEKKEQQARRQLIRGQPQIVQQLQQLKDLVSKQSHRRAQAVAPCEQVPAPCEKALAWASVGSSTDDSDLKGGLERGTSAGSGSSRSMDSFQSLREVLDHLHHFEDPERIIAVRNVRRLGPDAGVALRLHFQRFGPVEDVYTHPKQQRPGSKVPAGGQQARHGDLAFVVMESGAQAKEYLARTDLACISGSLVSVAPFLAGLRK